ncbi:MAG: saccharopine dehydrogenase NADP-binding domain-containing protein [Desulfobacterales bacterium]|nr:saccharopine dehydrogenase NADP-binding domain-containing protein [Desulfobacterales bacterium]
MKKIIVVGVGAQGSTIAKRLSEDLNISEIICADYDLKAAHALGDTLDKATAIQLDASDIKKVIEAAKGCDLIVNGLPVDFNEAIMEAALETNVNYMDMAGYVDDDIGFVESYKKMFSDWNKRFKAKHLTALIGAGSTPGFANVVARESVEKMDSCESIDINAYEGVWAKKFTPFWWSPEVALEDMGNVTYRVENGEIVEDHAYSRPVMLKFKGIEKEIRMVDHFHDEPVTMGLLADTVLKGVKNVAFRYGGPTVDLSENLLKLGMLSEEPVDYKGTRVIPMEFLLQLIPRPPKHPDEIQAIIDEGLELDEGAFQVRVEGMKDGKKIVVDNYAIAPGLVESFEKYKITQESFFTGQCAAVFTKMMANDKFTEKGLFVPEQLNDEARKYFLDELAKCGVTIDQTIEELTN